TGSKEKNMRRRVVITGIGVVSPLGHDRESTWQNVLAGKSGASAITQFHAETWPTRIACEVRDFEFPEDAVLPGHRAYLNRPSEFGAAAALEAVLDSGLFLTGVEPERFGVSIGASIGAISPHNLASLLAGMEVKE